VVSLSRTSALAVDMTILSLERDPRSHDEPASKPASTVLANHLL